MCSSGINYSKNIFYVNTKNYYNNNYTKLNKKIDSKANIMCNVLKYDSISLHNYNTNTLNKNNNNLQTNKEQEIITNNIDIEKDIMFSDSKIINLNSKLYEIKKLYNVDQENELLKIYYNDKILIYNTKLNLINIPNIFHKNNKKYLSTNNEFFYTNKEFVDYKKKFSPYTSNRSNNYVHTSNNNLNELLNNTKKFSFINKLTINDFDVFLNFNNEFKNSSSNLNKLNDNIININNKQEINVLAKDLDNSNVFLKNNIKISFKDNLSLYNKNNNISSNIISSNFNIEAPQEEMRNYINMIGITLPSSFNNSNFNINDTRIYHSFRPSNLPKKSKQEEDLHKKLVQENRKLYFYSLKKNIEQGKTFDKKFREGKLKDNESTKMWESEIIPYWFKKRKDTEFKKYFYKGIPPSLRCKIWLMCIGNSFSITPEYYEIELKKAM